jgi:hypothetical protein
MSGPPRTGQTGQKILGVPSVDKHAVWYVSCSCSWSCTRASESEAIAAADTHAVLKHSPRPAARPTW